MKYKLFGKNITPDCRYCLNFSNEGGKPFCEKSRTIVDGKCRAFKYDPLMRVPVSVSISGNFKAEDFQL